MPKNNVASRFLLKEVMMKVIIEKKRVFDADGKELAVGTEIEVKGDVMPEYLKGKASAKVLTTAKSTATKS